MFTETEDSSWISLSDLMTTLMMVFMFIALNYMIQFVEYEFVEKNIYNELNDKFSDEIDDGTIRLGPNGEVSFINKNISSEQLFKVGESEPTIFFKSQLNDFLPKYWEIIGDSSNITFIEEIRIEGHADSRPISSKFTLEKNYLENLKLSQDRSRNVLKHMRTLPMYENSNLKIKKQMDFLFAAIGFSSSRTVNKDGDYVFESDNKKSDDDLSRRVVFRIKTSKPELLQKVQKQNNED
jgi:outer membrane protein OmpA-like peptidoglycan-associated protein|tara:strand:- start:918 stop:1631 length:714 start_codon:yes stop_codon:yes gene_type:complete